VFFSLVLGGSRGSHAVGTIRTASIENRIRSTRTWAYVATWRESEPIQLYPAKRRKRTPNSVVKSRNLDILAVMFYLWDFVRPAKGVPATEVSRIIKRVRTGAENSASLAPAKRGSLRSVTTANQIKHGLTGQTRNLLCFLRHFALEAIARSSWVVRASRPAQGVAVGTSASARLARPWASVTADGGGSAGRTRFSTDRYDTCRHRRRGLSPLSPPVSSFSAN
jgi:hypothetical protein